MPEKHPKSHMAFELTDNHIFSSNTDEIILNIITFRIILLKHGHDL